MPNYALMKGRPDSAEGRLEKEMRVYDFLDRLGMEYWRTDHPDAEASTMEACREIDAVLGAVVCKNLFLTNRQHTDYYLLLMPGDKVFKTKEITKQIGSARLSFGSGEEMEALLDCHPGSASVLGLMNDKDNRVRLLVDRDVLAGEYLGAHPCMNTSSLKLKTSEVFGVFLREVHHDMTVVDLVGEERSGNRLLTCRQQGGCRNRFRCAGQGRLRKRETSISGEQIPPGGICSPLAYSIHSE